MSRLTRIAVIAALLTAPVLPIVTAASADAATVHHVGHRENVLRGWCTGSGWKHSFTKECVLDADDDTGRIGFIDAHGRHHVWHNGAKALAWVKHHSPACKYEDSNACYWDAGHQGNRVGDNFIVVGTRNPIVIYTQLF